MSLLPNNAQCPTCFKYDGWVGNRIAEHHRCKCPSEYDDLAANVERDLKFTMELQNRRAA